MWPFRLVVLLETGAAGWLLTSGRLKGDQGEHEKKNAARIDLRCAAPTDEVIKPRRQRPEDAAGKAGHQHQ